MQLPSDDSSWYVKNDYPYYTGITEYIFKVVQFQIKYPS